MGYGTSKGEVETPRQLADLSGVTALPFRLRG
jgi:hypothetical protein